MRANVVTKYFWNLKEIHTNPKGFFRKLPVKGGLSGPLAFALVTHWIGAAAQYVWVTVLGGMFSSHFGDLFDIASKVADVDSQGRGSEVIVEMKEKILDWMWGAGSILVDPFWTLASVFFTSFFVFVGARLFVSPGKEGAPEEITFETAIRVVCFGMAPTILTFIPVAGSFLSWIGVIVITVIAAKEIYRLDTGRAIVVGLFPKVVLLACVFMGLGVLMVVLFKFLATAISF
ncbi:hypothetical protein K2X30_09130 [bacterium]|nr:hypothetical protein [bacterium]